MQRPCAFFFASLALLTALFHPTPVPAQSPGETWRFTLLEGSAFLDDCLICGRPSILQPLGGTFDATLITSNKDTRTFAITNIDFHTRVGNPVLISGAGTLLLPAGTNSGTGQTMVLNLQVNDQQRVFTNDVSTVTRSWPMLETHVVQEQPNLVQFFSINIDAAPLRELWFTTSSTFASSNLNTEILPADILANSGRIVKRSSELTAAFGFMPGPGGAPVSAFTLGPTGDILLSLAHDEFSELQGVTWRAGDVLSERGTLVLRNHDLLQQFQPSPDLRSYGLDALQVLDNGVIVFSVETNFTSPLIGEISAGDVLAWQSNPSPTNWLHKTRQQLIAPFSPINLADDPGLDAVYLWPNGEIWFSTEHDFDTQKFGPLSHGDLLSDQGYIVFRNAELVAAFAPSTGTTNIGLNAIFPVTDSVRATQAATLTLRLAQPPAPNLRLAWSTASRAIQIESATEPAGPYVPFTAILQSTIANLTVTPTNSRAFFRIQQW